MNMGWIILLKKKVAAVEVEEDWLHVRSGSELNCLLSKTFARELVFQLLKPYQYDKSI